MEWVNFWDLYFVSLTNVSVLCKCHAAAATAAKLLQSCPTLCDPIDGSPPGPPSLGFSRREHWSGLPFPSPMHESEKWKWSRSVMSHSSRSHGLQPTRLLRPWDFPGKSTGVGCHCLLWLLTCHTPNCVGGESTKEGEAVLTLKSPRRLLGRPEISGT